MFSQKYVPLYKSLYAGFFFVSYTLVADLSVTITQVEPFPPVAVCGSGDTPGVYVQDTAVR